MSEPLDSALKARVRAVLDRRPVTESELRKLIEEGEACARILDARLARVEARMSDLSADPASSLAEIATEMRAANELRPDVAELHALLTDLEGLAREFRATWLSAR